MRVLRELALAFALLTRLPTAPPTPSRDGRGFVWRSPAPLAEGGRGEVAACVWAFPVAGAAVGVIGAAVFWLARGVAMPPALASILALAAQIVATGGFHEDGLADTADGFGGGTTREKKLEIMRDSRIGSFGVLALVLALAIRAAALVAIADRLRAGVALVAAGALGRAAMVGMLAVLHPARADGLGASVGAPGAGRVATALFFAVALAFAFFPPPLAAGAVLVAAAAGAATAWLAYAQIGGYTGDVLGAGEQATECAVLALLATAAGS